MKYKILVHNDVVQGKPIPQKYPLEYNQAEDEEVMEVTCGACGDKVPVIIRPLAQKKPGGLSSMAFYVLSFLIAIIFGVIGTYGSGNMGVGFIIAVLILGTSLLAFSEKEPVTISRKHSGYADKEQIHKKHEIQDMSAEFAEEHGIDPFKTF